MNFVVPHIELFPVISQYKVHSYDMDTLLSISTLLLSPEIAPVANSLAHEIWLSICLPTDHPLWPAPELSPQGNAPRSRSDLAVMELQDKLDLMIHPYRGLLAV